MEVDWSSVRNLCELIGSPYLSILFYTRSIKDSSVHGKIQKIFSRRKKLKNWNFRKGNTAKPTATIGKPGEPTSLTGNPEKFLSAIKTQWKWILVYKKPKFFFLRKNVHGKTSVDRFSFRKCSLYETCMEVAQVTLKSNFSWLEECRNHSSTKRSPWETFLFVEKLCKVISRTKNALKLISQKVQRNYFKFGNRNDKWTVFKKPEPCKTNPKTSGPRKRIPWKLKVLIWNL